MERSLSQQQGERPRLVVGGARAPRRVYERALRTFADVVELCPWGEKDGDGTLSYDPATGRLDEILSRLPAGWKPDFLYWFHPDLVPVPRGIEGAPCFTAAFYGSLDGSPATIEEDLPLFDLAACSEARHVDLLARLGARRAIHAPFTAYLESDIFRNRGKARHLDCVFIGEVALSGASPAYRTRDRVLRRVLELAESCRILVRPHWPGHEAQPSSRPKAPESPAEEGEPLSPGTARYVETLNWAKIVVHAAAGQQMDAALFAAMGCGALVFVEEDNAEALRWFTDREHVVCYRERTLPSLLRYYLAHGDEREALAAQGEKAARRFAFPERLRSCHALVEAEARGAAVRAVAPPSAEAWEMYEGRRDFMGGRVQSASLRFRAALTARPDDLEALNDAGAALGLTAMRQKSREVGAFAMEHFARALGAERNYILALYNYICLKHYVFNDPFDKEFQHLLVLSNVEDPAVLALADRGVCITPDAAQDRAVDLMARELSDNRAAFPGKDGEYHRRVCRILVRQAWKMRAEYWLGKNLVAQAVECMERALELVDKDPALEFTAAYHCFRMGSPEKSLPHLDRAIRDNPLELRGHEKKIFVLRQMGIQSEAVEVLREAQLLLRGLDGPQYEHARVAFGQLAEQFALLQAAAAAPKG